MKALSNQSLGSGAGAVAPPRLHYASTDQYLLQRILHVL